LFTTIFTFSTKAQFSSSVLQSELYQKGYLDVTLIGADSTGIKNSTEFIRKAVQMARDNDLVCFFPSGTYLVSDTIRCMRKCILRNGSWQPDNQQCVLEGDPKKRPLIKLMKGAPKYQDVMNPLPVFWFYSMSAYRAQPHCEGSIDPNCNQANISFNQLFKGIDLDLGNNPGAIGVRFPAAQGSTLEDVKINATGAFAGLFNPPGGQAGGTFNVEIIGGQYAVYEIATLQFNNGPVQQGNFTMLCGCKFYDQEKAVFYASPRHPMVVVGFQIRSKTGIININMPSDGYTLIDGVVEMNGGSLVDGNTTNIYIQNVYVKGANTVANSWSIAKPDTWTHIQEYSFCEPTGSSNLVNGELNTNEYKTQTPEVKINATELANELIHKHVWDDQNYPNFKLNNAVNVKDPLMMNGKPAKGDGIADDSEALNYAIANYKIVFLPKGNYLLGNTLKLGSQTHFIGTGRTYTTLTASKDWKGGANDPLLTTADDPDAETSLSNMSIRARNHPLEWKAGRNSIVRDVNAGVVFINGNGGGRWYALMNVVNQLSIVGTKQNLMFYGANPERAIDPQWKIENAENVHIYWMKTEAGTDNYPPMTSMRIINSKNIEIFGSAGNVTLEKSPGMGVIEVIDSKNITICHVNMFKMGKEWHEIKETNGGIVTSVPSTQKLALYKRK
jgi:hypothetical protein